MRITKTGEYGIAITGMGAVTPYGSGVERLWQSLLRGESAIGVMDLFDLGGIACTRAGVVRDYVPPPGFEREARATAFAAGACHEALQQAGLLDDSAALAEVALITASNFGAVDLGERALIPPEEDGYDASAAPFCAHTAPAAALALGFGFGGPRLPLSLSCAAGASALATAAGLIIAGHARRVVVVGYDALSRFSWSGLCALRTMTREEVRPFDLNRGGTIFSEGAAALVLERGDLAPAPLAWLRGWASGNNGHHMTAPAPRGAGSTAVMRGALARAGLPVAAVDHINAHGTGTKPNDITESEAIHDLFGERTARIPVTSIKGLLGHMLGAAGAVEAIVTALTLRHGVIPPTGNLTQQDPGCALDVVTEPRQLTVDCALSNSAGFGGCNAAVVLTTSAGAPASTPSAATPVAITGAGLICALGADALECAAALREGEPALFQLERFELPGAGEAPLAGEAPEVELARCGVTPKAYLDRASQLFLAACGMALHEGGLGGSQTETLEAGVLCGTTWGCAGSAELFFADYILKGPRLVKPFLFPHAYSNTAVSLAAIEWSLKGMHENVAGGACASGIALVEAFEHLRRQPGTLLAGGTEALSRTRMASELQALPDATPGEAGAALVLQSGETPANPHPLGWLLGCGLATAPEAALAGALAQAGMSGADLTAAVVNAGAHGAMAATLPGIELIEPERLCGNVAGASTALHLALGLLAGRKGAFAVVTAEEGTAVVLVAKV